MNKIEHWVQKAALQMWNTQYFRWIRGATHPCWRCDESALPAWWRSGWGWVCGSWAYPLAGLIPPAAESCSWSCHLHCAAPPVDSRTVADSPSRRGRKCMSGAACRACVGCTEDNWLVHWAQKALQSLAADWRTRIRGNAEDSVDSQVDSVGAVDLAMPWQRQPPPPPPPTLLFYSSNTNGQSEMSHSVCKRRGRYLWDKQ